MKALVKYSLAEYRETIDLEDYGHEPDVKWEDLTQEDKNEIHDTLSEQQQVGVSIEHKED